MKLSVLAAWLALLALPCAVPADWHGFLQLQGMTGGSQDPNHVGWMDVSFVTSGNVLQSGGMTSSNVVAERNLCLTKQIDAASPVLALQCSSGGGIASGALDITPDNTAAQVLHLQLSGVLITEFSENGAAGSASPVADNICLQARILNWNYSVVNTNSGLPSHYISSQWDFSANQGGGATNSPVFMVSGIQHTKGVELSWPVLAGQNFRIYAVNQLGAPFVPVAYLNATNSGAMSLNLPVTNNAMFYVVENVP
jgi:type VI secretion system secreted protein Hcp